MGFWNKKKEDKSAQVDKLMTQIRDLIEDDREFSMIAIVVNNKGGSSMIQGDPEALVKALKTTAESNEGLTDILKTVAGKLGGDNMKDRLKDEFDRLFTGLDPKKSKTVDLPNGMRGLAINAENIEDISEKEIDDIVGEMLKEINKGKKRDSDDSQE